MSKLNCVRETENCNWYTNKILCYYNDDHLRCHNIDYFNLLKFYIDDLTT